MQIFPIVFFVQTRRLAASFECLNSSPAQLTGTLCSCILHSDTKNMALVGFQKYYTLALKVLSRVVFLTRLR